MGGAKIGDSDLEQPLCPAEAADAEVGYHFTSIKRDDLVLDVIVSVPFWYWFYRYFLTITNRDFNIGFGVLAFAMLVWRVAHFLKEKKDRKLPYSCSSLVVDGCEIFLVATVHIAPRSPKDVKKVISEISPDLVMIELDPERLERLRGTPPPIDEQDLQPLTVEHNGRETLRAQRAIWNQQKEGSTVEGPIVFTQNNEYGNTKFEKDEVTDALCLVTRGGATAKEAAPFAIKAHNAALGGAKGLLVIDTEEKLPIVRLGSNTLIQEIKIAFKTKSGNLPPIPVLLLQRQDGLKLKESLARGTSARAEFTIMPDERHPCQSLWRRLCQSVAMIASGLGVLYGIIQCFPIDVGGEFVAADAEATSRGVTCVCVDVTVDRLWNRFATCLKPIPRNLAASILAWLAFPRSLLRTLFPPTASADVIGISVLNVLSFTLWTWLGFAIAGFCAGTVIFLVLQSVSLALAESATESGVAKKTNAAIIQYWLSLILELYALPRIYEAIAVSRDEAMYCGIAAGRKKHGSSKVVFVCGAAHANGILQRIRDRGL